MKCVLSRGDFSLIFKQECERDVSALTPLVLLHGGVSGAPTRGFCRLPGLSDGEQNVSLLVQVKAQWLRQARRLTQSRCLG